MFTPRAEQSRPPPSDHANEPSRKRRKTVSFSEYIELRVIDAADGSVLSSDISKMKKRRDGLPSNIERELDLIDRRLKYLLSTEFSSGTLVHSFPAAQDWAYYSVTELLNYFLVRKSTAQHVGDIAKVCCYCLIMAVLSSYDF